MNDIRLDSCECQHIKGICCSAKNCQHNEGECYCTADEINIGPHSAHTTQDTICATFKPRTK